MSAAIARVAVLWCPDWPVTAASAAAGLGSDAAVALIVKGVVFASSASARAEGVVRGLRLREAQARMPALELVDYDPALDNRMFEPVIEAMEQLVPAVQVLRPGVCAVRIRGVARFYGGERPAGLFLCGVANEAGARGARIGIADGVFTAEQAARGTSAADPLAIVAEGGSAAFLDPLSIGLLDDRQLAASAAGSDEVGIVTLLRRLGILTLGDLARLGVDDVFSRFGALGSRMHALAGGRDSWPLIPRTPPRELAVSVDFEPALYRVDQVAFGVRASADRFIAGITAAGLVTTAIRVQLDSESGEVSERIWAHPNSFDPGDVVDRVRWQLQGTGTADAGLSSGVTRVQIAPQAVDAIGNHESGLWGSGSDERIHHGLSRVQSMLGHGGVLMPTIGGGRTLSDRQQVVPWGDRPIGLRATDPPWPGQLPTPLPGTVFSPRHPVHVFSGDDRPVSVDERGAVSAPPVRFWAAQGTNEQTSSEQTPSGPGPSRQSSSRQNSDGVHAIAAWAGPWPIDERWWSDDARTAWRFQAVDDGGCAWLLVLDANGWWLEARYD